MIQLCLEIQPTFCIHNSAITGTTYSTSYIGQGYESRIIGCSNPLTILSLCIFILSGGSIFCSSDQLIISSYDKVSKLFLGERNCRGCSSGLNFSLASKIVSHHPLCLTRMRWQCFLGEQRRNFLREVFALYIQTASKVSPYCKSVEHQTEYVGRT